MGRVLGKVANIYMKFLAKSGEAIVNGYMQTRKIDLNKEGHDK